jgi:hypothetical protein
LIFSMPTIIQLLRSVLTAYGTCCKSPQLLLVAFSMNPVDFTAPHLTAKISYIPTDPKKNRPYHTDRTPWWWNQNAKDVSKSSTCWVRFQPKKCH